MADYEEDYDAEDLDPVEVKRPIGYRLMPKGTRLTCASLLLGLMCLLGICGLWMGAFGAVMLFRLAALHIAIGTGNTTVIPWAAAGCGLITLVTQLVGVVFIMKTRPIESSSSDQSIKRLWLFLPVGLTLLLILMGFTGATAYWYLQQQERLEHRLDDTFSKEFHKTVKGTESLHLMHMEFKCCGSRGPHDFFNHTNFIWTNTDATNPYAPFSCCNDTSTMDRCRRHLNTIGECHRGTVENPGQLEDWHRCGIFVDGCADVMGKFIKNRLLFILPAVAIAALAQLLVLLIFRFYQTASVVSVDQLDDSQVFGYLCGSANVDEQQYVRQKSNSSDPEENDSDESDENDDDFQGEEDDLDEENFDDLPPLEDVTPQPLVPDNDELADDSDSWETDSDASWETWDQDFDENWN